MSISCYILDHEISHQYTQILTERLFPYPCAVYDSSKNKTPFTLSFNQCLIEFLHSKKDWVMVCNNDIDFDLLRLLKIESILKEAPPGIYSPLINSFHTFMSAPRRNDLDFFRYEPWVEFVCPIIHRDVISAAGFLDTSLTLGYGIDIDYCYRAKSLGFNAGLIQDVYVQHFGHKSQKNHQEYNKDGILEMDKVLSDKYGVEWKDKLLWSH